MSEWWVPIGHLAQTRGQRVTAAWSQERPVGLAEAHSAMLPPRSRVGHPGPASKAWHTLITQQHRLSTAMGKKKK